jgi:hypothetical protein
MVLNGQVISEANQEILEANDFIKEGLNSI